MNNTLILTGWGWKDYGFAAAVALRHIKNADVRGMSTRRLPEFLSSFGASVGANASANAGGYREILILGVGLNGDPARLGEAVDELAKAGMKITFISALEIPASIDEATRRALNAFIGGATVADAVCRYFGEDGAAVMAMANEENPPKAARPFHLLLEAAMFFYRNHQDEKAYEKAIRAIAANVPEAAWEPALKQIAEHYKRYGDRELVGKSADIIRLREQINEIAACDHARVLITGESGTGKETVALQIHQKSARSKEPFIAFNCASVNPALLESRFLGYEKGAFTGADRRKMGVFEQANGGTLFLDEIGELPLDAQGVLLRVLEGGRFMRIGEKEEVDVDVRLIAATNRDLPTMVREGKFRADLFFRLNVVQIRTPSLRGHSEDIRAIADGRWIKIHKRHLSDANLDALCGYNWPGNGRELGNFLERADVLGRADFAPLLEEYRRSVAGLFESDAGGADADGAGGTGSASSTNTLPDNLKAAMKTHVRNVLAKMNGNLTQAAAALGISRNTVKGYLND